MGMSGPETKWSSVFGKFPDLDQDHGVWSGPDQVPIGPGPNFPNTSRDGARVHRRACREGLDVRKRSDMCWYASVCIQMHLNCGWGPGEGFGGRRSNGKHRGGQR